MDVICRNCESAIKGNYCNNCGQRTSINKVTFKETFQDFMDAVFSVSSPLLLTLKLLIVNPGKLFREYLNGKRKAYYKPVPFFVLTTIIYMLIRAFLNYNPMESIVAIESTKTSQNLVNSAAIYMAKNINSILFTFVLSFALVVKSFFFKKYRFAEYLAVSFYIIGFYMVITTVLIFGLQYVSEQYKMMPFIFMFFYVVYALTSLFQKKSIFIIIKIILLYFISLILYIILGYGLSLFIVWMKTI